jgi:hypothetical protein
MKEYQEKNQNQQLLKNLLNQMLNQKLNYRKLNQMLQQRKRKPLKKLLDMWKQIEMMTMKKK